MSHQTLRDIAKVGCGLVIADLIAVIWFSWSGFFPMTLLGITWHASSALPIAVLDISLIILLAHYGWSMKLPIQSPSERMLLMIVGVIFLVVSLAHLARLAFNWHIFIAGVGIPAWVSWAGFFVAGFLSYCSFHFARHMRR